MSEILGKFLLMMAGGQVAVGRVKICFGFVCFSLTSWCEAIRNLPQVLIYEFIMHDSKL